MALEFEADPESDSRPGLCRCKTLVLGDPEPLVKCQVCLEAEQLQVEAVTNEQPASEEPALAEVQVSALEDQHAMPLKVCQNSELHTVGREPKQEPPASIIEPKLEDMPKAKLASEQHEALPEALPEAQPEAQEAPEETETTQAKPTNTAVQPRKVSCTALRFTKSGISEKEFHRRLSFVKSKTTAKLQEPPLDLQQERNSPEPKVSATPEDALDLASRSGAGCVGHQSFDGGEA